MKLAPGSPEWLRTVTASKIPSILGVSRFKSQYALWHEMAGLVEPEPISEQTQELFDYGHAAEVAAAEYWKWRNPGWRLSRGEVQYSRDDLLIPNAATVDRRASRGRSRKIVEVKTAESLESWGDDGSGEIPTDYAAQLVWQQYISGLTDPIDLVLWPTWGRPRIYTQIYNHALAMAVLDRATAWTTSLADGTPPELDDSISCYETVRRLHPDIERDLEVELDPKLAAKYLDWTRELKATEKSARAVKTQVLDAMGNAQYATCRGHKIADRRNHASGRVALVANAKTDIHQLKETA